MLTNRNTCIWRTNTPSPTDGYKFDIKYLQLAVKWLFFAWVYVTCSLKCVFVWMCMYIQTQQAQEGANLKIELMLMDRQQSSKLFSFPLSCQSFLPFFYCSISVLFSLLLIRCFPFPMLAPCLSVWAWVCVHSSLWSIWLFSNGASVGSRVCCPWISFQMSLLLNGQVWLACACVSTTH